MRTDHQIDVARRRPGLDQGQESGELLDREVRTPQSDDLDAAVGSGRQTAPGGPQVLQADADGLVGRPAREGLLERRRLRRAADGVKERHRTGRGRCCSERLEEVLTGLGRQTLDDRDP